MVAGLHLAFPQTQIVRYTVKDVSVENMKSQNLVEAKQSDTELLQENRVDAVHVCCHKNQKVPAKKTHKFKMNDRTSGIIGAFSTAHSSQCLSLHKMCALHADDFHRAPLKHFAVHRNYH
jgi:hypothetical protein